MPELDFRSLPRLPILLGPTPLQPLPRLTEWLGGPTLWVKRDDLTPLALGGNKLRKLEFLLGAAKAQNADVIVTRGALQSNHACQTVAAANRYGMETILLLRGEPGGSPQGNLLLDLTFGATIHTSPNPPDDWEHQVADTLRREGRRPYPIPIGGSNPIGAIGFVTAGQELQDQISAANIPLTEVVVTSSSAGTQSGLVVAASALGVSWSVLGVSVDQPGPVLYDRVAALAYETASYLGLPSPDPSRIHVNDNFIGPSYGQLDDRHRAAIVALTRLEGLLVDPVYTGKALAALIHLAQQGRWSVKDHVLFWHTGGLGAFFAYADQLLDISKGE